MTGKMFSVVTPMLPFCAIIIYNVYSVVCHEEMQIACQSGNFPGETGKSGSVKSYLLYIYLFHLRIFSMTIHGVS